MNLVRRSVLFSVADRYLTQVLAVVTMMVTARILTPAQTGLFLVASGVILLAEAMRDFGAVAYIVQASDLTKPAVRTVFTTTLLLSLGMGTILFLSATHLAAFFGDPALALLLTIGTLGFVLVPFGTPAMGLLRRDMAFSVLAGLNVAAATASAAVTITLALFGAGAASYVWGSIAGSAVATGLAVAARPHRWIYRPCLSRWREVFTFGLYSSAVVLLNMGFDMLPRFALSRMLGFDAVGLYMRALSLCQLPDRAIVSALQPVVLPALASRARSQGDIKQGYLRGLSLMAAVQWPALATLALLADPVVALVLGDQWQAAAPLVRILAVGTMALAPAFMTYPVLVAVGRIRDTLTATLVSLPPSALLVIGAAPFGLDAVALSLLATAPLQMVVALFFIRRAIDLSFRELAQAYAASALVTLGTALVPACVIMLGSQGFALDLPRAAAGVCGAALGWLMTVYFSGHPLLGELQQTWLLVRPDASRRA